MASVEIDGEGGFSQRLKVLVVTDRFPPEFAGGAELSLSQLLSGLDGKSFDIKVVTIWGDPAISGRTVLIDRPVSFPPGRSADDGPLARWIKRIAFVAGGGRQGLRRALQLASRDPAVVGDNNAVGRNAGAISRLQAAIDDFRPDIVHADNADAIQLMRRVDARDARRVALVRDNRFLCAHAAQHVTIGENACAQCSADCVGSGTLAPLLRGELRQIAQERREALAASTHIATTSQFLARQIEALVPGRPVTVLGNPVPDIVPDAGQDEVPTVLFIGAMDRRKGPQLIADCFTAIANRFPDTEFIFAGKGPLEQEIAIRAQAAGIPGQVHCLGLVGRDGIGPLLSRASVVVTPTLWPEPFGRIPLEAAMAQRPVIASRIGGHLETVVDGKTGLLVPPGDRDALAAAILRLLGDRKEARAMGRAARSHVIAHFGANLVKGRLAQLWRDAAARTGRA